MGVHTDPDDVPEELGEMDKAYNWAVSQGGYQEIGGISVFRRQFLPIRA